MNGLTLITLGTIVTKNLPRRGNQPRCSTRNVAMESVL